MLSKGGLRVQDTRIVVIPLAIVLALLGACAPLPTQAPAPTPQIPEPFPAQEPETGYIEGRVLYRCNRQPVCDYYMYLFPGSEGTSYTSNTVVTDENGFYHITATPGSYRLIAHPEADVKGFSYFHASVKVDARETTIVDDILVYFCPEMKLTTPTDGAVLTTARPTFAWESYPGAVVYEVLVYGDGGTFYRFGETKKTTLTAEEELPPDNYEWYITAYEDEWKLDTLGDSHKWHFTVSELQ